MRRIALILLALGMASCGSTHPVPSALQRFDQLQPQMRRVTADSGRVAVDVGALNRAMQADDENGVRAVAARLKRHAEALLQSAGSTGNAVRSLIKSDRRKADTTYFRLTAQALSWQWYEAASLARLADGVWADPLLVTGNDESRLMALSGKAQWYAYQAQRSAHQAAAWRRTHARELRYVPVHRKASGG